MERTFTEAETNECFFCLLWAWHILSLSHSFTLCFKRQLLFPPCHFFSTLVFSWISMIYFVVDDCSDFSSMLLCTYKLHFFFFSPCGSFTVCVALPSWWSSSFFLSFFSFHLMIWYKFGFSMFSALLYFSSSFFWWKMATNFMTIIHQSPSLISFYIDPRQKKNCLCSPGSVMRAFLNAAHSTFHGNEIILCL